jgi:hypothetical protein
VHHGDLMADVGYRGAMEERGRVSRLFPPFSQNGLDDEGARLHPGSDFVVDELTADKAQEGGHSGSTIAGGTLFRFG